MFKRASLLSCSMLLLLFCVATQTCVAQEGPDVNGILGYKGMQALNGNWRPFNNSSPWNTVIPSDALAHSESHSIIEFMGTRTVRLGEEWNPTLHVVGAQASKYQYRAWSGTRHGKIYRFTHFNNNNWWNPDPNGDDITNDPYPYIVGVTYAEDRDDGLMIIVDKSAGNKYTSYEVSHGTSSATLESGYAPCTTFNIWNLGYRGIVTNRPICAKAAQGEVCDDYWFCAGGHGAGTSLIAGLIRPKELVNAVGAVIATTDPDYNPDVASGDGLIHHALKFAFNFNRCGPPLYPFAYRNDGPIAASYSCEEKSKPVEGMLFQLRADFDESQITNVYAKVVSSQNLMVKLNSNLAKLSIHKDLRFDKKAFTMLF